jgi:hypothetical protein
MAQQAVEVRVKELAALHLPQGFAVIERALTKWAQRVLIKIRKNDEINYYEMMQVCNHLTGCCSVSALNDRFAREPGCRTAARAPYGRRRC